MENKKITKKIDQKISIKVHGKWILAGEYAVLKSCPVLAFPLFSQFIELEYQRKKMGSITKITGKTENGYLHKLSNKPLPETVSVVSLFEAVLSQALKKISKNLSDLKGALHIRSHIAFGGGIGASAVLCVLIGRLFHFLNWLKKEELFSFCHSLENGLHGQSSGVDVAAVLTGKPILYTLNKDQSEPRIQVFRFPWKPFIFLSWSGENRSTKDNIKKMKLFWKKEEHKGRLLNAQMESAVLKAQQGLKTENQKKGISLLKESFCLAENCFFQWELIGAEMKKHISFLKNQGALAVKPTGAGKGGYVLSLWSKQPPAHLMDQLIPAF